MSSLLIENAHPSLAVDEAGLDRLARQVIDGERGTLRYLGLILADHDLVHKLNRTYLGHDYRTDVLSFSLLDDEEDGVVDGVVDGEVYVDLDTAAERHAEFGAGFEEEVRRYVVHGLLHLLGYDDATPEEKAAMHAREDHYLAA